MSCLVWIYLCECCSMSAHHSVNEVKVSEGAGIPLVLVLCICGFGLKHKWKIWWSWHQKEGRSWNLYRRERRACRGCYVTRWEQIPFFSLFSAAVTETGGWTTSLSWIQFFMHQLFWRCWMLWFLLNHLPSGDNLGHDLKGHLGWKMSYWLWTVLRRV